MNRFPWNLRYESPTEIPVAFYADNGPEGPIALPGTYTLKLTVARKSQAVAADVKVDPRLNVTEADLEKLFDLEMKVRDDIEALHTAVNQIRGVRSQLEIVKERMGEEGDKGKPILSAIEDLDRKMAPIEQELIQVKMKSSEGNLGFPNMLNEQYESFRSTMESADDAPTQQDYALFDNLHGRLQTEIAVWKQIASTDVPALNELIRKQNVALVEVLPGK
jgi:hypothetical protein